VIDYRGSTEVAGERTRSVLSLFDTYREFIPDWEGFQESLRFAPKPVIRVNLLKCAPDRLAARLASRGILLRPLAVAPDLFEYPADRGAGATLEYLAGWIHIQSLSSHVPVWVLDPSPDSLVLDLCAAPGGKTSQMAQRMHNTGLIVANEKKASRLSALGNTLTRLGVMNTIVVRYPGEDFPKRLKFDCILVDAPCSGEGRRRLGTEKRVMFYREPHPHLPELQKRLLVRAFDALKPGGRLVYSTCTYNPGENEAVISHLMREREAVLKPVSLPLPHCRGLAGYGGEWYGDELLQCARIYPHQVNSVGFFVSLVVKPPDSP